MNWELFYFLNKSTIDLMLIVGIWGFSILGCLSLLVQMKNDIADWMDTLYQDY